MLINRRMRTRSLFDEIGVIAFVDATTLYVPALGPQTLKANCSSHYRRPPRCMLMRACFRVLAASFVRGRISYLCAQSCNVHLMLFMLLCFREAKRLANRITSRRSPNLIRISGKFAEVGHKC